MIDTNKEIIKDIKVIKWKILKQRRYLPNKESGGIMDYWVGNNKRNKGLYVDLGGVIGKLDGLAIKYKNQLKQRKKLK